MATLGSWASRAEEAGFASVGVIDRLVYDNLDPLTALAAAAVSTQRVELLSSVINVCWRGNAVLLAKQLSSVNRLSAGRLVAGLGMGDGLVTMRPAELRSRAGRLYLNP
jgi:alkanesulfonate monooxygenase SsuD/methylene tetrahydromethanopterin reductase-like flavin-dependent oxidoreductase (luciferase family)